MEKVININFQGRVIPIEESAYVVLKQYIDGLRRHFAAEEGADEIVNDIENRIAELLSAVLKQGASCINIADLNAVMDSIGRVEEIKAAEGETEQDKKDSGKSSHNTNTASTSPLAADGFYRNADDKLIAGVCSGIAARMSFDPVIVRVLFVILGSITFWAYLILWLIVPLRSLNQNITKRLYRNPDDKVIAGVAGGLAEYFKFASWKIRLIFISPVVLSILFDTIDLFSWHGDGLIMGSFGASIFMLYIILWIAVPYALTTTERMEMKGEKIDLNSIKASSQARTQAPINNKVGSLIGRTFAVIFKVFFMVISGTVAIALFAALIAVTIGGATLAPFSGFFLHSYQDYILAWVGIVFTVGIPVLALIVWLVRRLMGVKSRRNYLGYIFSGLWIIGLFCAIAAIVNIASEFRFQGASDDEMAIQQPSGNKLYVNVMPRNFSGQRKFGIGKWNIQDEDFDFIDGDTMWLNNIRVNVERSDDAQYHMYFARTARGHSETAAKNTAEKINFSITQQDSVLTLSSGFPISIRDKFRNQRVLLTIAVPEGKGIYVAKEVDDFQWYSVTTGPKGIRYREHFRDGQRYDTETDYTMTAKGLRAADGSITRVIKDDDDDSDDE